MCSLSILRLNSAVTDWLKSPYLCVLCVFVKAVWPYCPVEHLLYMLFYSICTACTCLCSQINDDDDDNVTL